MRVLWAELRDFRNHAATEVRGIPDGLVAIVGPNGAGKTNLLEGMFFALTLGSPRAAGTGPLVRRGASAAYVRAEVETREGRALIEIEVPAGRAARVHLNRSPVRRKRDLRRRVRAVLFGPEDLEIVRGEPAARRRFLDEAVATIWPLREGLAPAYDRALRQRNRLLKDWDGGASPPGLGAWDAELVATGAALMRARAEAVGRVAEPAAQAFRAVAGYGLVCRYVPSVWGEDLEAAFAARLAERREDELARRTSLVGPHRDDLELAVRELGARSFGSHGEAWAAALALRLGLARAVEGEVGEAPVRFLDDPLAPLDPERQARVADLVRGHGQAFVAVADEAHVPAAAAAVWEVRAGSVRIREGV
ncbi:MAG TPA: DNA replication and repair protein RecF [Actinomycetota bacterium]|nr:DNA replication and repair protein RecF [Actinomycetota bacterium]